MHYRHMRLPAIWIGGKQSSNPLEWLGVLLGILPGLGVMLFLVFMLFIAPIVLLIRYLT